MTLEPPDTTSLAANRKGHIDSHYLATADEIPVYPSFRGKSETEVCVVGGGLAGLAVARELAKAGTSVILLEAQRIGWGASGRNGGFVSAGYAESIFAIEEQVGLDHARALYRHSAEAVGQIRSLLRDNGREDIVMGHGWLKLIRHGDVESLERRAERMARDYGQSFQFLTRDELTPHVTSERYHAGLLDMAPFHIHPLNYTSLLSRLAADAGVKIFEMSRARRITGNRKGFTVRAGWGKIEARHVVLATSALGGPSARMNSAILPVSTYMVSAKSKNIDRAIRFRGCIGDTRRASDYYRLTGQGQNQRLLWGGRISTRIGKPFRLAAGLRNDILQIFPQLGDLEVEHAWAGTMGYAIHKMPIIGRLGRGLWMASAFGGHGLNTCAMAGPMIANAITRGDDAWRLFDPFGAPRAGGFLGRIATQFEYWRMQAQDRAEEARAGSR